MSPRAAARLETLGFTKVYDYVNGKLDWLAAGLSTEGPSTEAPTAGDAVRGGDIICHLGERLGDALKRIRGADKDACIVVDDRHVVLGRVRGRALSGDPNAAIEDVMRSGPSTIRADMPLETVVKNLRDGNVSSTLVTDPEGHLIGSLYLDDAERKLAKQDGN